MNNKFKLSFLPLLAILLLSLCAGLATAQYATEKTTDVTIGSDGTFTATESDIGVTYLIQGTAGASGSVTAAVYSGNPQATASVPDGVGLRKFVVVTFDMDAADFEGATLMYTGINGAPSIIINVEACQTSLFNTVKVNSL